MRTYRKIQKSHDENTVHPRTRTDSTKRSAHSATSPRTRGWGVKQNN